MEVTKAVNVYSMFDVYLVFLEPSVSITDLLPTSVLIYLIRSVTSAVCSIQQDFFTLLLLKAQCDLFLRVTCPSVRYNTNVAKRLYFSGEIVFSLV